MRFLIDQNVDDAVARFLEDSGHAVFKVRDLVGPDAPDHLIMFIAETEGLTVITHDKDYKNIQKLLPAGFKRRLVRRSGIVNLSIDNAQALIRIQQNLDVIVLWDKQCAARRIRLQIQIGRSGIRLIDNASLD